MNGQQLKNSILQLAIQGRLVPQDSKDEPASALLARIREEKQRLVKDKKIKKEKPLAPITDDEKPFDIPESWEWVRLGEVSLDSADGPFGSNLKAEHYTQKNEVRIVQLSNIGELGWKDHNKKYTTYTHLESIKRSEVFPGDIIIAKMMPAVRAIICPNEDNKYVLSSDAVRFDISGEIFKMYIYWAINSNVFLTQVYGNVQGITRVRTSLTKLRKYIIPLPPLAEQYRIVEKIEELLPLVEEYDEAQKKLDKLNDELPEMLKKSVLQQAVMGKLDTRNDDDEPASVLLKRIKEEKAKLIKEKKIKKEKPLAPITDEEKPFDIPESWEWVRFGEIGDWGAGATPAKGNMDYYKNGTIPWLRTGDLNNGIVNDVEMRITEKALSECSLRICNVGDVLIAMYGATIGKVAIAGVKMTTNQACCACTPLYLYNKYLFYFLQANKDVFTKMGAGGAQPNISKEKIIISLFPLPPLAEQHRIVEKIEELLPLIDEMKKT